MRTRTALILGVVGGLAIIGMGVFALDMGRPAPGAVAVATAGPTVAAVASPSARPSATGTADPSGTAGSSMTIVAAGDITSCAVTSDSATAKLVEAIPGTVLALGDDAYETGSASEYRRCYDPTWGAVLDRTRPVPGNHEYLTPGAVGYFGYFGLQAGDPRTGYYAFDLGAWRLYALNSNCSDIGGCGPGSAEVSWLQADLASNHRQCVLAYWHHPRWSSGEHGSNAFVAGLWDTLSAAGAEIVLNGHDHDYERFAPLSATGQVGAANGIVEFVVGTGGRSHYPFNTILSTSRAHDNTTFGVIEITLGPDRWSSRFVPVAGQTFTDTASGTCH